MRNLSKMIVVLTLAIPIGAAPIAAYAQRSEPTQCKGQDQARCVSLSNCSWVKSYKTVRGTEVSAFCRKKPERKKSTEAPSPPRG